MFNFGKKKIAIVGAGNAGCITALHYSRYLDPSGVDIVIYHDPTIPIERVGQGTVVSPTELIANVLDIDWHNNPIDATFKSGVLYEGWGKKKEKIFHNFPMDSMAMHYVPQKLSNAVLESGKFKVIEKQIDDLEQEIDADVIFDCRGGKDRNEDNYETLINPLNSVLLYNRPGTDSTLLYTRSVATPNGWTFIIPNKGSISYGYLYNNTITSSKEARSDFLERFELPEVDGELHFSNYVAKNMFVGERTAINGNRYSFLEPLEATALDTYELVARYAWSHFVDDVKKEICNTEMKAVMNEVQNFILWHYQAGSQYDSPFWKYAKSLPFNPGYRFRRMMRDNVDEKYGNWSPRSFKIWRMNT